MKKSLFTKILGIVILAVGVMTIIFCFASVFSKDTLLGKMSYSGLRILWKDHEGSWYGVFGGIFSGIGLMSLFINNKKGGIQFIVNIVLLVVLVAALAILFTLIGRACAELGADLDIENPFALL